MSLSEESAAARRFAPRWGELSGAVADLGVFVPLTAALILVNGLDASGVFVAAGLLYLGAGGFFRVPFPVQPLKALTAVAVAGGLGPGVIHAAGLEVAVVLLLLSVTRVAGRLAKIFQKPVVRSLQLGVGLLLIRVSVELLTDPPEVFAGSLRGGPLVSLAILTLAAIALSVRARRYALLLAGLAISFGLTVVAADPATPGVSFEAPSVALPALGDFSTALYLLVIPQIPLTFGNAVVAVTNLAGEYFGPRASRVTPRAVCLSAGLGNALSSVFGGMPMCHGAGGLTAHYRLGARTAGMNLVLGAALLAGGLFFAPHLVGFFGLLPVWVLSALLSYAGIRHALLLLDLRGRALVTALVAGVAGALSGNLAVTTAVAAVLHHGARFFLSPEAVTEN